MAPATKEAQRAELAHGDTLLDPAHWDDEFFDAIVADLEGAS